MALDDDLKRLTEEISNEKAAKPTGRGKSGLDNDIESLQQEIIREEEFKSVISQGQQALKDQDFPRARIFFERAKAIHPESADARDGLIQSLFKAGQAAEQRKAFGKIFGLFEAADYYQALQKFDPENSSANVRLNAVRRALRMVKFGAGAFGIVLIFLCVFLTFVGLRSNDLFYWSPQVCKNLVLGDKLCTPAPPATLTAIFTSTLTPLPSITPIPSFTPRPTITPTITSTPVYVEVWVKQNTVYFYKNGIGDEKNGALANLNAHYYVCSSLSAAGRVLLSPDRCHITTPTGWMTVQYLAFSPVTP